MNIPIYEPNISQYTKSAFDAINSGWISNHGIYIKLATEKLKEITKAKHIILMSNGTTATHCLFLALKFKHPEIDTIYVSNNCFVAAWNTLLMEYPTKALNVMKMNENTWNIDTSEEYIMSLQQNSAMLVVHNLGNIINVPRLKRLRPDMIFIEDNCEGIFGKYENMFSGTSNCTLCSSVSFYGNKNITTGEGGAFFTNDDNVYNYILKIYSHGMSDVRYIHCLHAYNYRMTNVQAGFLYDQLMDIENILEKKRNIFSNYDKLLKKFLDKQIIKTFEQEENTQHANWMYAIKIVDNCQTIDQTTKFFMDRGVDVRPFFYPINCHHHLNDIKSDDVVAKTLNAEIIMIPSYPNLSYEKQLYISLVVENFLYSIAKL